MKQIGAALILNGFNTQPPEGGWESMDRLIDAFKGFNTQPPEGGWGVHRRSSTLLLCFNTQPPEGGWPQFPFILPIVQ